MILLHSLEMVEIKELVRSLRNGENLGDYKMQEYQAEEAKIRW